MMIEVEGKGDQLLNANDEKLGQVVLTDGAELVMVTGDTPSQFANPQKHFVAIPDPGFGRRITVRGRRVKILKAIVGYV